MDLLATLTESAGDVEKASRAVRLFWAMLGLLGIVFFGLALMMTVRRAARRRASSRGGEASMTESAWSESARRLNISPIDGDADPDHDTVDFDPDGDGPTRR